MLTLLVCTTFAIGATICSAGQCLKTILTSLRASCQNYRFRTQLNLVSNFHPIHPGRHEVPNGYQRSDRVLTPQRESLRSAS